MPDRAGLVGDPQRFGAIRQVEVVIGVAAPRTGFVRGGQALERVFARQLEHHEPRFRVALDVPQEARVEKRAQPRQQVLLRLAADLFGSLQREAACEHP